MQVILKETIESLGTIGSEVKVADGYARNYLLPQGKALLANEHNRKIMAQQKSKIILQLAREKASAEEAAKRIEGLQVQVRAKVSEENRLYGSVGVRDIQEALKEKGIEVEKKMILLAEPIKMLGTYTVPIRIYKEVEPEITVEVIAE
ncbi:50S ribosomal protein L9 [Desulfatirhabdium butyrativorans]|uniref:50S ribosomal protein L9 n=1 Tax=Desulfatirhabdium butyrativorans TaxID=340467 RepID=UPI0003F56F2F|nr:50S ribosomal protein L9 [Desulfatirhabdium butyrativorans]